MDGNQKGYYENVTVPDENAIAACQSSVKQKIVACEENIQNYTNEIKTYNIIIEDLKVKKSAVTETANVLHKAYSSIVDTELNIQLKQQEEDLRTYYEDNDKLIIEYDERIKNLEEKIKQERIKKENLDAEFKQCQNKTKVIQVWHSIG